MERNDTQITYHTHLAFPERAVTQIYDNDTGCTSFHSNLLCRERRYTLDLSIRDVVPAGGKQTVHAEVRVALKYCRYETQQGMLGCKDQPADTLQYL